MSEGLARKLDGMSIRMRIGATLEKREFEYSNVGRSHEEAAAIAQADFDSYQASCGFDLLSGSAKEVDSFCASFLKLPLTPPAGESLAGQQSKRAFGGVEAVAFGHRWELVIGVIQGVIYKLALFSQTSVKGEAAERIRSVLKFVLIEYGNADQDENGIALWDLADGNLIVQHAAVGEQFVVNVFLTSSAISGIGAEHEKRRWNAS